MNNVERMQLLLANLQLINLKLQGMHWNIRGPMFFSIHALSEQHYKDILEFIDTLAERIRQHDALVPVSINNYQKLSIFSEFVHDANAIDMINDIVADFKKVLNLFCETLENFQDNKDSVTEDIIIEIISFIEKAIWLYSSHLEEQ